MDPLTANPFSVLTFIAAPAVLTNASAVMGLSTANRIGRVVDRNRVLIALLDKPDASGDPLLPLHLRELDVNSRRAGFLVRALTSFYLAVGSFAASSLISLLGMVLLLSERVWLTKLAIGIGLVCGSVAVGGVVTGAALLVWETRLALAITSQSAEFITQRLQALQALQGTGLSSVGGKDGFTGAGTSGELRA